MEYRIDESPILQYAEDDQMNYDSAMFELTVRQVICTIKIMDDANRLYPLIGKDIPFPMDSKTEHAVVKRTYRQLYNPNVAAADIDEAVRRAIEKYHRGDADEN